jgi:uncharacterized protein (TIGR02271 family)
MDSLSNQYQFRQGDEVYAASGEKVGKLVAIEGTYLVVEKGWLFPKDYYVPSSVVQSYNDADGVIYLSVTKDEALASGWEQRDETYRTDQTLTETGEERLVVPVHEEELTATTTMREAGDVQITKRVEAEEQTLEVPVTEERAQVTRRTVDRDATTGEDVFTEERIDVPLRTEDVELQKRTRVAEEIEVAKEQVQRTERVSGTVRKEKVDVDDVTDPREPEWGAGERS